MSMTAISVICLIAILWIAREIIVGTWAWLDYRKIKHDRNVERTRRQFAEARNDLVRTAIAREVDFNSASFKYFYYINTVFMRRPDQYLEFHAALVRVFLNPHDSSPSEELMAESKNWSPAFRRVVRVTADAMGYVVLDYSWLMRLAFRLEKRFNPDSTPLRMLRHAAEKLAEKEQPIADIRHTQNVMYRMAGATA